MPLTAIDYSKTIMYKIVPNDLNISECYIGHTINFTNRKRLHKCRCNNQKTEGYNFKVYKTIRDNGGWDNWSMVLVESYPCSNRLEAAARERYWYENLNGNLNSQVPNTTHNESVKNWKNNNPEKVLLQAKKDCAIYRKKNTKKINCDCGGRYTILNKSTHLKSKKHLKFFSNNIVNASDKTEETETL
jgi:hypothetical protein